MYLLNKNNKGYITPEQFNSFSELAQQAIFEDLFYTYAKWIVNKTNRRANSSYSDIPKNVREMIDVFSTYTTSANFTFSTVNNLWSYIGNDFYRTENLSLVVNSNKKKVNVEEVSKSIINSLVNSQISAPTLIHPIYEKVGSDYRVYPIVPADYSLEMLFIRTPKTPKWTYINVNGDPLYNASATDLQNFELPEALYEMLIVKIMGYCGINLREVEIVQLENQEEVKNLQKTS